MVNLVGRKTASVTGYSLRNIVVKTVMLRLTELVHGLRVLPDEASSEEIPVFAISEWHFV